MQHVLPELRFLGEQDGPAERELKVLLTALFQRERSVQMAYLIRADCGTGTRRRPVLGVKANLLFRAELVQTIGQIFASVFIDQEHLDIVLVHGKLEEQVSTICAPFFTLEKQAL